MKTKFLVKITSVVLLFVLFLACSKKDVGYGYGKQSKPLKKPANGTMMGK